MPAINQDVSIPRGDDSVILLDIGPDTGSGLVGLKVVWRVWPYRNGLPYKGTGPVIEKSSEDDTLSIVNLTAQTVSIPMEREDTIDLDLGNYHHEAAIQDAGGAYLTVTVGVLTLGPVEGDPLT